MTSLASSRGCVPAAAAVRTLSVVATRRISPSFQRLTLRSTGDGFEGDFEYLGFDHWFRLFLPAADGRLRLPKGEGAGWFARWRSIPLGERPAVRNYTIRDARRVGAAWEIDVDVVVHGGEQPGVACTWALRARPGERVGFLDQGRMFSGADHSGPILVIVDASGLPAAEAIARSLPGRCRFLVEVPYSADRRELAGAHVDTVSIEGPGVGLVSRLPGVLRPDMHLFVAGEAGLALAARAAARTAGIPDEHVDFCAYWRKHASADFPA